MRVVCTLEPGGRVYRFYRTGEDFTRAFKPLVPFLLASGADVVVGNDIDDQQLLLRVGPIFGEKEALFLGLVEPSLTCHCEVIPTAL